MNFDCDYRQEPGCLADVGVLDVDDDVALAPDIDNDDV
jgi:hypothetical protein